MTPERKKYLAKCSSKEKWIRANITYYKQQLTSLKRAKPTISGMSRHLRGHIRHTKYNLNAYRHELDRLKGMDGVVVPKRAYIGYYGDKGGLCKCGKHITDKENFCFRCGRRILWEKVK